MKFKSERFKISCNDRIHVITNIDCLFNKESQRRQHRAFCRQFENGRRFPLQIISTKNPEIYVEAWYRFNFASRKRFYSTTLGLIMECQASHDFGLRLAIRFILQTGVRTLDQRIEVTIRGRVFKMNPKFEGLCYDVKRAVALLEFLERKFAKQTEKRPKLNTHYTFRKWNQCNKIKQKGNPYLYKLHLIQESSIKAIWKLFSSSLSHWINPWRSSNRLEKKLNELRHKRRFHYWRHAHFSSRAYILAWRARWF